MILFVNSLILILFAISLHSTLVEADLLKAQNIVLFTVGIGTKYVVDQLKQIASSPSLYIHAADSFEGMFDKLGEITRKVCTVQADIAFETTINVQCGKGELRYLKASVKSLSFDFVAVYKETIRGAVNLLHSFTTTNPTVDDHDSRGHVFDTSRWSKLDAPSLFFAVEENAEEYVYLTVECVDTDNEVEILVRNEDF